MPRNIILHEESNVNEGNVISYLSIIIFQVGKIITFGGGATFPAIEPFDGPYPFSMATNGADPDLITTGSVSTFLIKAISEIRFPSHDFDIQQKFDLKRI